ncbi:glycosyltransferase [Ensifer sp. 22521]|uniref:glycosyltransferase n=1 Tax=Ensifer sp. 22521 TaxID=3453935 RepID=UPI003F86F8D3
MSSRLGEILIVTEELAGLNRSGGIGACALGQSLHLRSLGYQVDVLITDLDCSQATQREQLRNFSSFTVRFLRDLVDADDVVSQPVDAISKSYCVYRYIKSQNYHVVHFNDWLGSGFYTAMARRQGLISSVIVTHLHGSSEWVRRHNKNLPRLEEFETEAIEKSQIENSDLVISPSEYLLDWYTASGIRLPKSRVCNWLLPQWFNDGFDGEQPLSCAPVAPGSIDTLIFFGRHERRKGFELFLSAAAVFPKSFQPNLVFLGRFDRLNQEFSGSAALRKLSGYGGEIDFVNDLHQQDALRFIRKAKSALCVMPSVVENSPCVVGECFTIGTPFIATNVGGIAELIAPDSRKACLPEAEPKALAEAIQRAAVLGIDRLESTLVPRRIKEAWAEIHAALQQNAEEMVEVDSSRPLVSVCITHYERPNFLRLALQQLEAQSYDNVEIVIVDDGSRTKESHEELDIIERTNFRFPVKILREPNKYLGAARNTAARHAKGDYLLFHDDDNVAEKQEIEVFVKAALSSGADVLTCQAFVFRADDARGPFVHDIVGQERRSIEFYPIGIGGIFSYFRNRFGDANALIKRSVFAKLGGFTELRGVGFEDWELFLRAHLMGYKLGIVPEPLFHYRVSSGGMLATGDTAQNFQRIFEAVDGVKSTADGDIIRYAISGDLSEQITNLTCHNLSKERAADHHRRLMSVDPNSSEAREILAELAVKLGRTRDAINISVGRQREELVRQASQGKLKPRLHRQELQHETIRTGDRGQCYILRGWLVDRCGHPRNPKAMLFGHEYFKPLLVERYERPDVQRALGLDDSTNLGVKALLQRERSELLLDKITFARSAKIAMPKSGHAKLLCGESQLKGHIDNMVACDAIRVPLPQDGSWEGEMEIVTGHGVDVAVKWNSKAIEFGSPQSYRKHFVIPCLDRRREAVDIFLPLGISVDVYFY